MGLFTTDPYEGEYDDLNPRDEDNKYWGLPPESHSRRDDTDKDNDDTDEDHDDGTKRKQRPAAEQTWAAPAYRQLTLEELAERERQTAEWEQQKAIDNRRFMRNVIIGTTLIGGIVLGIIAYNAYRHHSEQPAALPAEQPEKYKSK